MGWDGRACACAYAYARACGARDGAREEAYLECRMSAA
jgi:hypothetical protein